MKQTLASLVCWLLSLCWLFPASAQNVRVMQWNVHKGQGRKSNNTSAQALAEARIVNFNQPDILLFNELDASNQSAAVNEAAIIDWVTNNVSYLGSQPGVSFYVKASAQYDGFNRNAIVSRYPILSATTYDDGLRGLHSIRVQVPGLSELQIFHAHLKCCSDSSACSVRQGEAQFDSNTIRSWAATNATPYIFAGDWNEDEENSQCVLTTTYHPISTIRTNASLVAFRPTDLNGNSKTLSPPTPNIRFDYCFAGTNRLSVVSGYVFNTTVWAQHGLYTNVSPQNLTGDSATASDHCCVFADYAFSPEILGIVRTSNNIQVTWMTGVGKTNALQVSNGGATGIYSNNFSNLFVLTNVTGTATNYFDIGGATNRPSRYYRIQLQP